METRIRRKSPSGLLWTAFALVVIGALNWGLIGLFNFNLVSAIFGSFTAVSRIIYLLVGLAAIVLLVLASRFREQTRA